MSNAEGYKVFTHDLRSPIQVGDPVWDGSVPHDLPAVDLDTSSAECGRGWNYCSTVATALRIAGLWPNGRPSRVFGVAPPPGAEFVERGDKSRASTLTVLRELPEEEVAIGIRDFSQAFGKHADAMTEEQLAWRRALWRPLDDEEVVEHGLRAALEARGLTWKLRRFDSVWDATAAHAVWDARAAWGDKDVWNARDAWSSRAAWAAWAARDSWAALTVKAVKVCWNAKTAWNAWDAKAAWNALTVQYASRQGWIEHDSGLLTTGIREAYEHGLEIVLPTGPDELGWVMLSEDAAESSQN